MNELRRPSRTISTVEEFLAPPDKVVAPQLTFSRTPSGGRARAQFTKISTGCEGLRREADTPLDPFIETVGTPTDSAH
jgi:hypothetical protein